MADSGLTAGQRSALALEAGGTPEDAKEHGVNHANVRIAKVIRERAPDVYAMLQRGECGIAKGYKLTCGGSEPPAHPAAAIFPMMGPKDRARLRAGLEEHGYRKGEPAVLLHADGRVIDGRNRVSVCNELGIEYPTEVYDGPEEEILGLVLSRNLDRRQLNESQRAMVAAKLATLKQGRPSKKASIDGFKRDDAAKALNVSPASVDRAAKVLNSGDVRLIAEVEAGKKKVSQAARSLGTARKPRPVKGPPVTPADVQITAPRPRDVAVQLSNAINRLAEMAEKYDAGWLRLNYPSELVKDLDLSLAAASDFLAALLVEHRARKNAPADAAAGTSSTLN